MSTEMEAVRVHVVSTDVATPEPPKPLRCVRSIFHTFVLQPGDTVEVCAISDLRRRITFINGNDASVFIGRPGMGPIDTAALHSPEAAMISLVSPTIVETSGALVMTNDLSGAGTAMVSVIMEYFQ